MPKLRLDPSLCSIDTSGLSVEQYGDVEHFLTRPDDYVSCLLEASGAEDAEPAQRAIRALIQHVIRNGSPICQDGRQLFDFLETKVRLLPTGCSSVDAILRGGLRDGQLTELAGESASGKTQLCHLAALHGACRGERVLYLDTTNSFSPARLLDMAPAATGTAQGQQVPPPVVEQLLSRITVLRLHSIDALLSSLDELGCQLQQLPEAQRPKVVLLDSLSAVVSPVLGGQQHSQGHVLMTCLAHLLKHLAEYFRLAVLVTNHVVSSGRDGGHKPALGEHWRSQPHVRLLLSKAQGQLRRATVTSCLVGAAGAEAWFVLGPDGPQDLRQPNA